jgi:hypothetical protein
MKLKKSLVGAVLVLALSGGGFATMAMANTSAPGDTPLGKIGQSVDGPPPAGVTVTPGELAEPEIGKIGESVDGPPPAGVTVTPGEVAEPAR